MTVLRKLFHDHPASVGESYVEHLAVASTFGARMLFGGIACIIHALLPFLFVTTGSDQIRHLHGLMVEKRNRKSVGAPSSGLREEMPATPPLQTGGDQHAWRIFIFPMLLCVGLATVAIVGSPRLGISTILAALLLGMAVRAILPSRIDAIEPGLGIVARSILCLGIALLGLRVVGGDLLALGSTALILVVVSLGITIIGGFWLARLLRVPIDSAAISATSVAVCGASAALAVSAAAPPRDGLERETMLIIVIVSLLSSIVMIAYPWIAQRAGYDHVATSLLLGATIHDVAQVAGAGFAVSPDVGARAVSVKMIRVACLLPVVASLGLLFASGVRPAGAPRPRAIPSFMIAFFLLAIIASSGLADGPALEFGKQLAGWALTAAVAGIGLKTRLRDLRGTPPSLLAALVGQSALQFAAVVILLHYLYA